VMGLRLHPGAQAGLQRAVPTSNGPAGSNCPSAVVSTRGVPWVTAASTATSSAWMGEAAGRVGWGTKVGMFGWRDG
jgi:hypothetical protein